MHTHMHAYARAHTHTHIIIYSTLTKIYTLNKIINGMFTHTERYSLCYSYMKTEGKFLTDFFFLICC